MSYMPRYTKPEIEGKNREVKGEVEERLEETKRAREDFERATEIINTQDTPVLQETTRELNRLGQELAQEGVKEGEEKAELVDKAIEILKHFEEEYGDLRAWEEREVIKILERRGIVNNPSFRRIIEQTIRARQEAINYIKDVQIDLKEHRQENESKVQRERRIFYQVANNVKKFIE